MSSILLLSTGSISVRLSAKLRHRLENDGNTVIHICTENAWNLWAKSGKMDPADPADFVSFDMECQKYFSTNVVDHIELVKSHDVCVVCPADFNIVGKMANGIADDVVSSILAAWLGSEKPLYVAEAMNTMMYKNKAHLDNVDMLKSYGAKFIMPTVKDLACGGVGFGALADIGTIANIVEGHGWLPPVDDVFGDILDTYDIWDEDLPRFDEPGAFGAERKYDRHEGVDICTYLDEKVKAVEDGEVVDSYQYTGKAADCGWWNDTWCIKVKGRSGVVTYGELKMPDGTTGYPEIGTHVKAGDYIGRVGQVLPDEKKRHDIRHHNVCMLHMELRTENCHLDGWKLDGKRDKKLLDPTPYLHLINKTID